MTENVLVVNLYPGEPEFGAWCEACLLPSAVNVPLTLEIDGCPSSVMQMIFCLDCDWTNR